MLRNAHSNPHIAPSGVRPPSFGPWKSVNRNFLLNRILVYRHKFLWPKKKMAQYWVLPVNNWSQIFESILSKVRSTAFKIGLILVYCADHTLLTKLLWEMKSVGHDSCWLKQGRLTLISGSFDVQNIMAEIIVSNRLQEYYACHPSYISWCIQFRMSRENSWLPWCYTVTHFVTILMYAPCILYSLLSRPTNAQQLLYICCAG